MLATMALASCFILLDAQTIQMCTSKFFSLLNFSFLDAQTKLMKMESESDTKNVFFKVEEKRGHTGSYGKQILYKTLAQVLFTHFAIVT